MVREVKSIGGVPAIAGELDEKWMGRVVYYYSLVPSSLGRR